MFEKPVDANFPRNYPVDFSIRPFIDSSLNQFNEQFLSQRRHTLWYKINKTYFCANTKLSYGYDIILKTYTVKIFIKIVFIHRLIEINVLIF